MDEQIQCLEEKFRVFVFNKRVDTVVRQLIADYEGSGNILTENTLQQQANRLCTAY